VGPKNSKFFPWKSGWKQTWFHRDWIDLGPIPLECPLETSRSLCWPNLVQIDHVVLEIWALELEGILGEMAFSTHIWHVITGCEFSVLGGGWPLQDSCWSKWLFSNALPALTWPRHIQGTSPSWAGTDMTPISILFMHHMYNMNIHSWI
jgi:hypothetical protein